jgi:hypothetical protein
MLAAVVGNAAAAADDGAAPKEQRSLSRKLMPASDVQEDDARMVAQIFAFLRVRVFSTAPSIQTCMFF